MFVKTVPSIKKNFHYGNKLLLWERLLIKGSVGYLLGFLDVSSHMGVLKCEFPDASSSMRVLMCEFLNVSSSMEV